MARNMLSSKTVKGLTPETEALLNEVRKTYRESTGKRHVAKAARKRDFFMKCAVIFSVFTGLMVILHLSGFLLMIG